MKTKKQFTNRILSLVLALVMALGMLPMTAFAATEVNDLLYNYASLLEYTDGTTQYVTHNNYLYKVTYTNLRPEEFTNVALSRSSYDYVQLFKTTSLYVSLYRNHDSADRVKTSDLPKSEGSSLSCYDFYGYDNAVNQEQPIVIITCIAVNEPTWSWTDISSATATFTAKDADVFTKANATISSENDAANTKTIYTATVTFNGTKYTDTKIVSVPHEHPICGDSDCSDSAHTVNDSWTAWDGTTAFPGGNVYLSDDVILTAPISVTGIVSLCLNGHSINAAGGYFDVSDNGTLNLCSCKDNGVFKRTSTTNALISADNGATANLYNVILDGGAVWGGTTDTTLLRGTANSGNVSSSPLIDAGYQRTAGGHITLNSGVVLQNNECSDAGDGGAVTIGEDGTLVINGATIRNNAKTSGNAGAIKAYAGAEITLNSGEIYGNSAYKHGGAIQIFGGDSTDNADAVLTMNGGTIRNNKATGVGGGIAVSDYSQFVMNGGSIIENTTTDSQKRGGGVGFADADTAMSVSGNAVISGNTANNLYIGTNSCNILTVGAMGSAADIAVTMKNSSGGVFTDGGAAYVERFYSDDSDFSVTVDGENLMLSHIHSYTYTANDNVITETCTCGHKETATITAPVGTIVYDGSEKDGATVSYSNGWLGGSLTVTYVNNIHAGQATASITKAGATASVKFTINKAEPAYALPMGITAAYGETLANISISDWGSGWRWKDPDQSVGNAGMHSFKAVFTPNDINNYSEIEVDVTVTVRKALLIVTANDKAIIYGDAPSNDGVRYTGFVGNENPDVLGGTLTYSYTYSQYGDVGTYDITVGGLTSDNYEITYVKGTLTVKQKEIGISWGATNFIPYTGEMIVPQATATGLADGYSCEIIVSVVETVDGAGVNPGKWTAKITGLSNPNYKLPENSSVPLELPYTIYANQKAPDVNGVSETIKGKNDGYISGLTTEMEYATEPTGINSAYTKIIDPNMTFVPGTYYVRYVAKDYYYASAYTEVTVGAGRKLQIVVPQNQVGYTVTVNKTEMEYEGSYTLKVEIHEGYTATEDFKIIISNWECGQQAGAEETYMNAIADQIIEVRGVADITPPAAEIKVKENKWTSFWNNLTFGLFFKETQDVTITVDDAGSGVKSIQYYLFDRELERDEVRSITDWIDYNGTFKIEPNNHYIIYAKVTDHAGNTTYINSDRITLDNVAATLEGIEDGKTYYGDLTVIKSDEQFYDIKTVTLDGEEIGFAEGTYGLIPADNAEHIVVVEDHAGNKTTYTVTVMKNYTVTYKADGEPISTETVGHGKDANLPAVPAKNGYVGKWDSDGKNITGDTTITVVYTEIPVVKPNDVKPEDKTDLEDTKKQLEDMLKDDSYTDEDKKNIQDAIDDIDDALEAIGNIEEVEETISKLPAVDTVKPDDEEAIKAITDAQTAYNALSDYEKSLVDEAAKANLDKLVAALVAYDIVEGDGSSWTVDSDHNITFVVNGLFSKFVGIKIDGKDVDKANYEVKAGSTIITLKASYLDTLAVGEHTITVVYTDGSTDGTFNVHAKANSPATGDNSNMFLWIALLFISGGAVITLTVVDRKRRMASNR